MTLELLYGIGVLATRVLQILVGLVLCMLGYRLFAKVPQETGSAEFKLTEQLKFNLTKVGPGVFFALFGTAVLVQALVNPLKLERESRAGADGTVIEKTLIAGQRDTTVVSAQNAVAAVSLDEAFRLLRFLNSLESELRADRPITQRVSFEVDLRETKLVVIGAAWNPEWGDYALFVAWARGDRAATPSQEALQLWNAT